MCINPLIIVYDKDGTVEVYGECFNLIGLFCLLLLHVSIIFLNLQPPNVNTKIQGWARSPCNGNNFTSICECVCRGPKSVGGITRAKRTHAQSQYWAVKSDQ